MIFIFFHFWWELNNVFLYFLKDEWRKKESYREKFCQMTIFVTVFLFLLMTTDVSLSFEIIVQWARGINGIKNVFFTYLPPTLNSCCRDVYKKAISLFLFLTKRISSFIFYNFFIYTNILCTYICESISVLCMCVNV